MCLQTQPFHKLSGHITVNVVHAATAHDQLNEQFRLEMNKCINPKRGGQSGPSGATGRQATEGRPG